MVPFCAAKKRRRIFAREALGYQRLRRMPCWLRYAAALARRAADEKRLRTRDLLKAPSL